MNFLQIIREMNNTKKVMDKLMACVEKGQTEYYKEYVRVSTYYLKLSQRKAALQEA